MKRTTRKLSGHAKDRFFARFIAVEPGLDPKLAGHLAARCQSTFTSVRIRKSVGLDWVRRAKEVAPLTPAAPTPSAAPPGPVTPTLRAAAEFDPYVFGLVPVFQREGRDGLLDRLATIDGIADLRAMAKTQQVVLPAEFRNGEVEPGQLRIAIADAVAKRIADRRAAAG